MKIFEFHEKTWARLNAGRTRIAHALLFAGPSGILKTELAYAFAGSLLCESPLQNGAACETCHACNWFSQGNHPDFRWLRPARDVSGSRAEIPAADGEGVADGKAASKEIRIEQIRELGDFLNVGTHRAGHRVILVTPAEAMNRNTANALLKSLEEPRQGTVFLLVSSHPERLLPTVRSRCQTVFVQQPPAALALSWLEGQGVRDASRCLAVAGGAPQTAQRISTGGQQSLLQMLQDKLAQGRRLDTIAVASEIDKMLKTDPALGAFQVVDWVQRWIFDLIAKTNALPIRYFVAQDQQMGALARQTSIKRLLKFNDKSVVFKKLSEHTLNNKLFLEDLFICYTYLFSPEPD